LSRFISTLIALAHRLAHEKIRKFSGFEIAPGALSVLPGKDYTVEDRGITGDAPKDFIRMRPPGMTGQARS